MQSLFLHPWGLPMLTKNDPMIERINELVQTVAAKTGAFCEAFAEQRIKRHYTDSLFPILVVGLGLEIIQNEKRLYLSTGDLSEQGLLKLTNEAIRLFRLESDKPSALCIDRPKIIDRTDLVQKQMHRQMSELLLLSSERAYDRSGDEGTLLREIKDALGAQIKSAKIALRTLSLTYEEDIQRVLILNSEGLLSEDIRHNSRIRASFSLGTAAVSSDWTQYVLDREIRPEDCVRIQEYFFDTIKGAEAMRKAKTFAALSRERGQTSTELPVVIAPGEGGTLWHESCGHQLEAIAIWQAYRQAGYKADGEKPLIDPSKESCNDFAFRFRQQVASSKVTLIDDPTVKGLYGSERIDDEGNYSRKNVLIQNGVLKNYLCDRYAGGLIGLGSNGCGRRQNYTFAPISRMSNTYLAPGEDDESEMIKDVPFGLFVKRFGGGSGGRIFSLLCSEAYLIENGEVTVPVARCMLTGRGSDIINKVDRVGKTLQWDMGSFCGASSGLIPTTASQPMVRISEMKVGK